MRGGKAADCHHGGEMIDPDDRMAKAGQKALAECCRHPTAHHVVSKGWLGQQDQGDKCSKTDRFALMDSAPRSSLAARAWLDIPCPAPDKPLPTKRRNGPCQTIS